MAVDISNEKINDPFLWKGDSFREIISKMRVKVDQVAVE